MYVGISTKDDGILVGKLDRNGKFTLHVYQKQYYGSGIAFNLLNHGGFEPRVVYELQSGMLVPGTVTIERPFVPTPKGVPIRFADYRYHPGSIPIWNLPGRFVLKSELKNKEQV